MQYYRGYTIILHYIAKIWIKINAVNTFLYLITVPSKYTKVLKRRIAYLRSSRMLKMGFDRIYWPLFGGAGGGNGLHEWAIGHVWNWAEGQRNSFYILLRLFSNAFIKGWGNECIKGVFFIKNRNCKFREWEELPIWIYIVVDLQPRISLP